MLLGAAGGCAIFSRGSSRCPPGILLGSTGALPGLSRGLPGVFRRCQTSRQADKQKRKQTSRQTIRPTDRQADRLTGRQSGRLADGRTDRRTDGQTDGRWTARDRHAPAQRAVHSRKHTAHSREQRSNAAHGSQRAACSPQQSVRKQRLQTAPGTMQNHASFHDAFRSNKDANGNSFVNLKHSL